MMVYRFRLAPCTLFHNTYGVYIYISLAVHYISLELIQPPCRLGTHYFKGYSHCQIVFNTMKGNTYPYINKILYVFGHLCMVQCSKELYPHGNICTVDKDVNVIGMGEVDGG